MGDVRVEDGSVGRGELHVGPIGRAASHRRQRRPGPVVVTHGDASAVALYMRSVTSMYSSTISKMTSRQLLTSFMRLTIWPTGMPAIASFPERAMRRMALEFKMNCKGIGSVPG